MAQLELQFGTFIADRSLDSFLPCHGPVFHRWLPDGIADAVAIELPELSATVRFWCERRGYVEDKGFVQYDIERREVDPTVMIRQAHLDGGALYGSIHLDGVPDSQVQAIEGGETNSENYVALGKLVIKKILDPALQRFTKLLRDSFGQYWIRVPESFDSRRYSLGQHCHLLNLKWRDKDRTWREFVPTDRKHATITVTLRRLSYGDFLTRDDWRRIGDLLQTGPEPSLAATIASRATRLLHEQRISHALIEVTTALEIAVEERLRHAIKGDATLKDTIAPFWDQPLRARLTVAAALGTTVPVSDLHAALKCIEQRHEIVHEGADPREDAPELISQALRVVGALAVPPILKRPPAPVGNELRARAEDWDTGE